MFADHRRYMHLHLLIQVDMRNDPKKPEHVESSQSVPMTRPTRTRQRIRATLGMLGSLLVGAAVVLGAMVLFRQGLLPLINAVFLPSPETLSMIRRAGILLTGVGAYWAYVRWHEKRRVTELHLEPVALILGGVGGAALIALPICLLFVIGAYEMAIYRGASTALFGVAALIGIAATLEELVFRCLLFRVIERTWGTAIALSIQAVLFAFQHLENVAQGGVLDAATMLVAVVVLGLLWGGLFVLTRNLWVAAANHAAWNFTILLSGVPLSGIEDWRPQAPFESRYAGPDWLTGGVFGPESSLLVIFFATIAVVLLLRTAKRRGAFVVPVGESERRAEAGLPACP